MYTKVTYDLGEVREIQKYIPGNYGAPGCARERKRKRTPAEIKAQNERNKRRKVQRLIMANFGEGDLHVTLTYRKEERPETAEMANALRAKFLSELRKGFKKAGVELKYIGVTEIGSRGAAHHHIIVNNPEGMDVIKLIQKSWKHGHAYYSALYEDGEFEQLADYLLKGESDKGASYTRSRNLKIPEPKRELVRSKRWKDPPTVPKGWEIIKETVFNGVNPVTGYPYQRYMMRRIHDSQHLHSPNNQRAGKAGRDRNIRPGGDNSAGPVHKDLQGKARGKRKRGMDEDSWISAEPYDTPFGP